MNTNTEVKLTRKALKAQYAAQKEAAKAEGKTFETWAEYAIAYDAQWDLAHPNAKDALVAVTTDQVLAAVDGAIAATVTASATVKAEGTVSKAKLAEAIFKAELDAKGAAGLVRKDIMARFKMPVADGGAGLTQAGANTYYQNARAKFKLVNNNG